MHPPPPVLATVRQTLHRSWALLVLAGLAGLISACAQRLLPLHMTLPTAPRGHQLHGHVADMRTLRLVDFDTLVRNLATAHFIALGEEHYHPAIQAFELRLLKALAQQRPHQLALAMEFLERDAQETVDTYLAHTIDRETLLRRLNASAAFQRLYAPLIHYAQQARLPTVAMNLPRRISRQVTKTGLQSVLQSLNPADRALIPPALPAVPERYRTYFLDRVQEHHPVEGEQAIRFTDASFLKDVTMARALALFFEQHPHHTVLAIAGRFHMDYGIAIPALLQQQWPQVNMRRLTTMTVSRRSAIDLRQLQAENIADYICFFPPAPPRHASAQ